MIASFNSNDLKELENIADHDLQYELLRELISVEHTASVQSNRMGIWDQLNKAFIDLASHRNRKQSMQKKPASEEDAASKGNQLTYEEAHGKYVQTSGRAYVTCLNELTITNVGPFSDSQTVKFSQNKDKPITLIGGQTGWKTTLINH